MQPTCLNIIYIIAPWYCAWQASSSPTAMWPHGTTESILTYDRKHLSIVHSVGQVSRFTRSCRECRVSVELTTAETGCAFYSSPGIDGQLDTMLSKAKMPSSLAMTVVEADKSTVVYYPYPRVHKQYRRVHRTRRNPQVLLPEIPTKLGNVGTPDGASSLLVASATGQGPKRAREMDN